MSVRRWSRGDAQACRGTCRSRYGGVDGADRRRSDDGRTTAQDGRRVSRDLGAVVGAPENQLTKVGDGRKVEAAGGDGDDATTEQLWHGHHAHPVVDGGRSTEAAVFERQRRVDMKLAEIRDGGDAVGAARDRTHAAFEGAERLWVAHSTHVRLLRDGAYEHEDVAGRLLAVLTQALNVA